jgi:hypothetical protein
MSYFKKFFKSYKSFIEGKKNYNKSFIRAEDALEKWLQFYGNEPYILPV